MIKKLICWLLIAGIAVSCGDDEPDLAPPEERIAAAIAELRSELTAPPNGWKMAYKPTEESGTFFLLMKFEENGDVNIQSDVPANDGEFRNQTTTYRIDNSLGVELIFDTYGVLHYLFELENSTFGAEFEFVYVGKEGENLIFRSKSDFIDATEVTFEPAASNDDDLFGVQIAQSLDAFSEIGLQGEDTRQQIILEDRNISLVWAIDLEQRSLNVEFAGVGSSKEELLSNPIVLLNQSTSYSLEDDMMVFNEPIEFNLNGFRNEISKLTLGDFESTGPSLCSTGPNNTPNFSGSTPGIGTTSIQNTVLSSSGIGFTNDVYTVNSFFIFDGEGNSQADDEENTGLIIEAFPDVLGFAFLYGVELNDPNIPIFSLGVILDEGVLVFREFTATTTDVNRVEVELLDEYFYRGEEEGDPMPAGFEEALRDVTDQMFVGGEFYAYDFPIEGFEIFRLFNPCNEWEWLLVK